MKKIILLLCLLFSMPLRALDINQDLYILRLGPPGNSIDAYTQPIAEGYRRAGYRVSIVGFNDCASSQTWYHENKNRQIIFYTYVDSHVFSDSCVLPITENSLVTIVARHYHSLCVGPNSNLTTDTLLKITKPRIGYWNNPAQAIILRDHLADLGVKDYRLISYTGTGLVQATLSGDVDYSFFNTEGIILNPGGRCLFTSARPGKIDNRVSFESINPNMRRKETGMIPVYVAYNVNINQVRKDIIQFLSQDEKIQKNLSLYEPAGLAAGRSPKENWTVVNNYFKSFKK